MKFGNECSFTWQIRMRDTMFVNLIKSFFKNNSIWCAELCLICSWDTE